jgi:predicted transglutaminase-like cysteine proteinase
MLAVVWNGPSHAGGTVMEMKGRAFPPPAFNAFCAHEKSLCSTSKGAKIVALTPVLKKQLVSVNRSVNFRIIERSDPKAYRKADDWRVPAKFGDCEDFAILKKKELMARGWPASALLLTVARAGREGHTVLTVRTDSGDLILDNRTTSIKDWSRTPYRYFARQAQGQGSKWERIGGAAPIGSTAGVQRP